MVFAATLADRSPIATGRLGASPAAAIDEIVEILAGLLNRPVPLFAVGQILLPNILAGNPALVALVCVQLLRLSLYGFFHAPIVSKN